MTETWEAGDAGDMIKKLQKNPLKTFYEHPVIRALGEPGKYPSYIDSRDFGVTLFDILTTAGTDESVVQNALEKIEHGIDRIANDHLKEALRALVNTVKVEETQLEKQIASTRQAIEAWFDASMERASGWYKRSAQWRGLAFGLILAIAFNADAVGFSRSLWRDSVLRESVSNAAVAYAERGEEIKSKEAQQQLEQLGLPLGWSLELDDLDPGTPADPRDFPVTPWTWIVKVFGVLLTGFAISFGAPLWFDLLNRFVNMRGTGKKPEQ